MLALLVGGPAVSQGSEPRNLSLWREEERVWRRDTHFFMSWALETVQTNPMAPARGSGAQEMESLSRQLFSSGNSAPKEGSMNFWCQYSCLCCTYINECFTMNCVTARDMNRVLISGYHVKLQCGSPLQKWAAVPLADKAELPDARLRNSIVRSSVRCWVQRI